MDGHGQDFLLDLRRGLGVRMAGKMLRDAKRRVGGKRLRAGLLAGFFWVVGCGNGAVETSPMLGGMPRCDASLLHPRIQVGSVAGQPGKTIVYVDGVIACVDETSKVDQILTQLETKSPGILAR